MAVPPVTKTPSTGPGWEMRLWNAGRNTPPLKWCGTRAAFTLRAKSRTTSTKSCIICYPLTYSISPPYLSANAVDGYEEARVSHPSLWTVLDTWHGLANVNRFGYTTESTRSSKATNTLRPINGALSARTSFTSKTRCRRKIDKALTLTCVKSIGNPTWKVMSWAPANSS